MHLKVADLERALVFYCGVLGFELMQTRPGAAFISAGGYHHHIGLNTWESHGGSPPPLGTTGLYHIAILYPTRVKLANALRRLIEANIPLESKSSKRRNPPSRNSSGLSDLPRRLRVDRQRMHATLKLLRQRGVDHAVTLQTALSAEGCRHNIESEMGFAARAVSGVAFVQMRFVLDMQALGCESR